MLNFKFQFNANWFKMKSDGK